METSETLQTEVVVTKGIFTGLPTFPPSLTGLSAVVVGASGISGQHMLHVLSQSPNRWSKVYALSRSLPHIPEDMNERIVHVPVDLLTGPEEIAAVLKEAQVKAQVSPSYIYHKTHHVSIGTTSSSSPTFSQLPSQVQLCGPILLK
jgi:hypothetical protein